MESKENPRKIKGITEREGKTRGKGEYYSFSD